MASYAYTFNSGDGVTPTRLNAARTVSDIVNADIKSDAAIAGTKIAPDFGSQNIATTGQVSAGGNFVTAITGFGGLSMTSNATSGNTEIIGRRSRGTPASPTVVQSGDNLITIAGQGYDGSSYANAAFITMAVGAAAGSGDMPGLITFSTTADGASTPTERMRIDASGNVGIGTTAPNTRVHAQGTSFVAIKAKTTSADSSAALILENDARDWRIQCQGGDSDKLYFYDNTATATRMVIDASGNIGIGTTAPTQLLQVGNGTASTISYILGDLNGYGAGLQIHNDNTGNSAAAYIDFGLGADTTAASIHARKQSDGSADLALLASNTAGTTADAIVIDGSTNNTGIGTATPNASAVLDVSSTTKGFLPPRMTTAQRDAISTPPAGLVIYNTSTNVLNFYNGSAWGAV
jgi:hypothetical protein